MWPFKKRKDPVSIRLSAHASDITVLYSRWYQLELSLATLDKKVSDLEKILKNSRVRITIVENK
jgi:hypothetical protein